MGARKSLLELLGEEGLLDDEGVLQARRHARRDGTPLVVALLDDGRVHERQLLDVLERRLKLPRVDPATVFVEMDAVREVTYDLAVAHCLLPLGLERVGSRRILRVAMADPLDAEAVEEIEASSGCRVEAAIAPPSELGPAIEKAYRGIVTKLIHRGGVGGRERAASPVTEEVATQPLHHIEEEAPLEVRLRALVQLLVERGVIQDDDYVEAIKRLLKADLAG